MSASESRNKIVELPGRASFATTHWSVVLGAGQEDSSAASESLEKLCRTYWYPLYAYIRRSGRDPHTAEDLTQEFFLRLLEKNYLKNIQREGGRFRSYLLTALKHFLINEHQARIVARRGGGQPLLSLDELQAEARYQVETADPATPENLFDQRWASMLLQQAMERLRADYAADGKVDLFDQLKPYLTGAEHTQAYADLAARLGMSEDALKMAVFRLRKRYGAALRAEVAQTVTGPHEIEEEIRHLIRLSVK
ncbi:MAG: sigma-70 family RNA polymerase sigma factor [Pedosphaera sp.]|nr:sigma-70 family RNA polymerase sigma factor [Pedosphaera sp.]